MEKSKRLETFKKWHLAMIQHPNSLVDAGFVWTGVKDHMKCESCGCIVKDWCTSHIPLQRHLDESWNRCEFLRNLLGIKFLACYRNLRIQQICCYICNKREACMVLKTCGHVVTCELCLNVLKKHCPVCLKQIYGSIQVFFLLLRIYNTYHNVF